MYRSKKEPYKYSMNFNLNNSYFGTSPQAKQNAKKWMNGINSAVNQIAKEYNIPEKEVEIARGPLNGHLAGKELLHSVEVHLLEVGAWQCRQT